MKYLILILTLSCKAPEPKPQPGDFPFAPGTPLVDEATSRDLRHGLDHAALEERVRRLEEEN